MSTKPISSTKKTKEKNPLSKTLNIERMNSSQIQEEISKEEKLFNNFISHSKYSEAESIDKKITALKKLLNQKKLKEMKQRHIAEKEHLKIDEFSDINNLQFYWEQKFSELNSKSEAAFEELRKNQELEYQNILTFKDMNVNIKPSPLVLEYQKEEEGLVKLKKFKEAEFIRKKKEEQKKIDANKIEKNKEKSFKLMLKNLKHKHDGELLLLQSKFQTEFDELMKEKEKQIEFINKKYAVKNKDLIDQQKRENNINKYNNYRKRNEQLNINYDKNFEVDLKEYVQQKPMENIERLYAELQDKNIIEGLEDEKNSEKISDNDVVVEKENTNGEIIEDIERDEIL